MTVETMHQKLKQRFDLVTMYRNAEAFAKVGMLFKETIGRTDYYYLAAHQHHHIVCRSCNTMECLPCDHTVIRVPHFKNITHQLVLTGVCDHCDDSKNKK
jgi:Fe2+ or Zn2+ uptake regulation protein